MKLYEINRQSLLLGEHCYLDSTDECYFIDVYECKHSRGIKSRILHLKHGSSFEIHRASVDITLALPPEWGSSYTFVAMPSSNNSRNHLKAVLDLLPVNDVRDLLLPVCDTPRSCQGWRPPPHFRASFVMINPRELEPKPAVVVIVDDVVATGSHFRAAKMLIRNQWPDMRVIGLFLARACHRFEGSCNQCVEFRGLTELTPMPDLV